MNWVGFQALAKEREKTNHMFRTFVYAAALMTIAVASPVWAGTATLDLTPSSGTVYYLGQTLQLEVSISNIATTSPFYAYTFDLAFDPNVFQAQSATDGTIFAGGLYFTGTIDNTAGLISFHSGLDLAQTFTGTDGLLGTFDFVPVAKNAVTGSQIFIQNAAFQSFEGAQFSLSDIAVNLPTGTYDVATPEPLSLGLMAGGLAVLALAARRRVQ
jgi:hypothetical protein